MDDEIHDMDIASKLRSWLDRAVHQLYTLGADEAKMYNCLIFRGRVGPNARLTASMQ